MCLLSHHSLNVLSRVGSFNPGASTTFQGGNAAAIIQTPSGRNFTGRLATEICALNSTLENFAYNASSTSAHISGFLWVATELNIVYVVVLTNSSVTNDLFPIGSMGILGLGVNLWRGSAPNASLIASYLPYVILYFFLSLCV